MKRLKRLLLYGGLLLPLCMSGQDPSPIRFVNTGKMNVAQNATSSLYIPWSVKMTGESSIVQNGKTCIGGSFYQHAFTNVFKVGNDGWGTDFSSGTVSFMKENPGKKRFITVTGEDIQSFDRSLRYIAFPKIQINTGDTIKLPERMGIDAKEVKLAGSSVEGILYLQSNPNDAKDKVFDASLRITGNGTALGNISSNNLVDEGSVVIERDLSIYRNSTENDDNVGYGALFGFASPFTAQKAGYFAGNYVRTVSSGLKEADYKSINWHTQYPYANEAGQDGYILPQYYVHGANDYFNPTQAYLIRPQSTGSNYTDLPAGFIDTEGSHDLAKFIFNGKIYNLPAYKEQVFAEDSLVNRTLNLSQSQMTSTFNWVIGNSYTCAIDAQAIVEEIMQNSALYYYEVLYICPPGSTTFQPYYTGTGSDVPKVVDLTDIPSQTIFMVRVAKNFEQKGSFHIDRRMLTHGKRSHNLKSESKAPYNELIFRLYPEENPNIYDLAAIGLRENTQNSIEKVQSGASDCFQLYSPNTNNVSMSVNLIDLNSGSVPVSVKAPSIGGQFVLNISRIESLETEGVWLKDLKTGSLTDLSGKEDYSYEFDMEPGDNPDRFMVYFKAPTAIDEVNATYLQCYYNNDNLIIKGLLAEDEGSIVSIIDMNGRIIQKTIIDNYPEINIPVNIMEGVYIANIAGKRSVTLKFVK